MKRQNRRNPASTIDHEAARELELYVENDGDLYRQMVKPIQKNLARKMVNGTYRPVAAEKAWLYLMDAGAKKYTREFGTPGAQIFSAATRRHVAARFARDFEQRVKSGEIDVGKESGLARFRKNPSGKRLSTIPPLSEWNTYAGGISSARGQHSYDFYPTSGRNTKYQIDPMSYVSNGRRYPDGYVLASFGFPPHYAWNHHGKNGEVIGMSDYRFRTPQSAAVAARKHWARI